MAMGQKIGGWELKHYGLIHIIGPSKLVNAILVNSSAFAAFIIVKFQAIANCRTSYNVVLVVQ